MTRGSEGRVNKRLFGNAIAKVTQQRSSSSSQAASSISTQVAAKHVRKSVFDRMENPPFGQTSVDTSDSGYGPVKNSRLRSARAGPYTAQDNSTEKWVHDKFQGGGAVTVGYSVFVRNIPKNTTNSQLETLFSKAGEIVSIKVRF